ncbi:MAG: hypothetical protein P1U56_12170 [Saprospiraceae bacterium]|nr:hypothetical protein [Saprospiraceae bacterium]
MKNAHTKLLILVFIQFSLLVGLNAQQSTLEYSVKSTKIQKLGKTKSIRELAPMASTSRAKKEGYKRNKQAPDNFIGRGVSKVTRPELEHQGPDPVRQSKMGTRAGTEPLVNVSGLFNGFGSPHDPTGDIGTTHYVQAINATQIGVFSKDGELESSFSGNTLWTEFNKNGAGDPIVLFDEMANRWVITEFAFPADVLIAISDTEDPLGSYTAYNFSTPSFPDYPKYSIWPNALVFTSNENGAGQLHNYFIQRDSLMAGADDVTMQRIQITGSTNTEAGFYVSTPLDFNGTMMPNDSLPKVLKINDSSWGQVPEDRLELFEFDIDWDNTFNTTVQQTNLVTAPFDSYPCAAEGFGFACVPQLGGSGLDAIPEVIMNVPQYRNFGTHEAIVLSFITDATNGQNQSAIRWMELRKEGENDWVIHQEGTYAPDEKDRYMSSIAIDKFGNIALGYNVSSFNDYVGIRYTGRFANDPLGQMTVEEITVVDGQNPIFSAQSGRFGDYAQMGLDPVDENTFWYTSEYAGNGSNNTRTRIVAFKIEKDSFDAAPITILSPVSSSTLTSTEQVTVQIQNRGINDIENLTLGLIYEGTTIGTFVVPETLGENAIYEHTFAETIDMSQIGDYSFEVFTNFDEDLNISNDTLAALVSQIPDLDGALSVPNSLETCDSSRDILFTLTNQGFSAITSAQIEITLGEMIIDTVDFAGNIERGGSAEVAAFIPELAEGDNSVKGRIIGINNASDEVSENDEATIEVAFLTGFVEHMLEIILDDFPQETSWALNNSGTSQLIGFGGGYSEQNSTIRETFCLEKNSCYTFAIFDNSSDGICCNFGNGSYQLINADGEIVAMGGDFGAVEQTDFCVDVECAIELNVEVGDNSDEANPNGSIFITATGGVEPYQYSIDGGTSFQDNALFENLPDGIYDIVVSDAADCDVMQEVELSLVTSIVEIADGYNITVSPNPSDGFYHVSIKGYETQKFAMNMQVLDINGRIIQEMPLQKYNGVFEGDLSLVAYPSGSYYLRFLDEGINSIARLVRL